MPYITVPSGFADTGGNFYDSNFVALFDGKYVTMSDNCGPASLSVGASGGNIDWQGGTGTDCTTPGIGGGAGNTHSSRTGYYELNKMMEIARGQLPNNSWLQGQLRANMNINNSCNAFWNGSTINFYRSGGKESKQMRIRFEFLDMS